MQQHKQKVNIKVKQTVNNLSWDNAISDAEKQLATIKLWATKLRVAIRNFRHLKASKMPFPPGDAHDSATQK